MFTYAVEQCDVKNKKQLQDYRDIVTKWRTWLDGEDIHSISKQIFSLFWRDSVFRMVNELRKSASESPSEVVGFNGPVIGVFDAGFACVQAMTIRRLIEPQWGRPDRAVVSLRALVDELISQRELITREIYVSNNGLPYDYQEVYLRWLETPRNSAGCIPSEGPDAWGKSDMFHKSFDKLSGIKKDMRNRSDLVRPELLTALRNRLAVCEDVDTYTNKFIAHAADPDNRQHLTDDQDKLTLKKLDDCCKAIYLVANFVGALVGKGGCISPIPRPQYDQLKYLDKKSATDVALEMARTKWDERVKETELWENDLWPQ